MGRPARVLFSALALSAACARHVPTRAPPPADVDLGRLVNPFVGTRGSGNTFPGAAAPFGMVQVSPDTGGMAGYDADDEAIYGFSQNHLSGVGCPALGDVPLMPTVGPIRERPQANAARFSHAGEEARPGDYRVRLATGIGVELTATPRTGWQRYTFPAGETRGNVLVYAGTSLQRVLDSETRVVGDREIEGRVRAGGFCAGAEDEHEVWFLARFDRPFAASGTWAGGAWATFDTTRERRVVAKVAISYTGLDGARKNLAGETAAIGFDFDRARDRLVETWRGLLREIEIEGGPEDRRAAFYTALYHALLHPNLTGDVDGRYMGFDGRVHVASGFIPRANFSLWDTYRPQNQLLALVAPEVARDTYLSILAGAKEGGWLPKWTLLARETNVMTGDPVTPFLVEGWSKGLLAGHEEEAYALLRRNATERPPAASPFNGRAGIEEYARLGYVPSGLVPGIDCKHAFGDNDCAHPASATLEYAAADAALATMARALGHASDADLFAGRARAYRNLWDRESGTFRPRTRAGTWVSPFDPAHGGRAFHEGGAYQYQWTVPHDLGGVVGLLGGARAAETRLDAFFAYDALVADPARTAREAWVRGPYEYYGKTTYNPNNEPDLLAPYAYLWARAPHKTSTVLRAAWTLFTNGPDGMTGNDDLGTMSAWYVLTSLGLYPTMSGAAFFALSTPQFEHARVRGAIAIDAPGATRDPFIVAAELDGRPFDRTWVAWEDLRRGATLRYRLASAPGAWGTHEADAPPSLQGQAPSRRDLAASIDDLLLPTGPQAQTTKAVVAVLAHVEGTLHVAIDVRAPPGWTIEPAHAELDLASNGLPSQREVALRITAPALATPRVDEIAVHVASAAGSVDTRSRVAIRTPRCNMKLDGVLRARTTHDEAQCAVNLAEAFNRDGTAELGQPSKASFDGSRRCFDAARMPPAGPLVLDGVVYALPDPRGDAPNFVEARGQSILLPAGRYDALQILGAGHHHGAARTATVTYADGTTAAVPFAFSDWTGPPAHGEEIAFTTAAGVRDGGETAGSASIFAIRVPIDPGRAVRMLTLPEEPRLQIYALTLHGRVPRP